MKNFIYMVDLADNSIRVIKTKDIKHYKCKQVIFTYSIIEAERYLTV